MEDTSNLLADKRPATEPSRPKWLLPAVFVALIISMIAVAVLATLLAGAKTSGEARTVSVTGEATLKAEPNEYVFYPSYTFTNDDKAAALAEMTKKSDDVVAGLKQVGVADKNIKTNTSGYDSPGPVYYDGAPDIRKSQPTYNLQLTVTVADKAAAQKAQDYLLTTSPTGSVSPQAQFSQAKRKQLENQARDQATKDARSKADQSAKNLGFEVGKVKTVSDGSGFGVMPMEGKTMMALDSASSSAASPPQLAVQPGENDLSYTVTVVYEIK